MGLEPGPDQHQKCTRGLRNRVEARFQVAPKVYHIAELMAQNYTKAQERLRFFVGVYFGYPRTDPSREKFRAAPRGRFGKFRDFFALSVRAGKLPLVALSDEPAQGQDL